jgi:hypothetical protein
MVERLHQARIGEKGIIMRKRNKHSFTKRQKELERKKRPRKRWRGGKARGIRRLRLKNHKPPIERRTDRVLAQGEDASSILLSRSKDRLK